MADAEVIDLRPPFALRAGWCAGCTARDAQLIPVPMMLGGALLLCAACVAHWMWIEEDERQERLELVADDIAHRIGGGA